MYAGNFSGITLRALAPGLYCQTNTLGVDGIVRIAVEPSPAIVSASLPNAQLVLNGTGRKTNGSYYVLTSTNIAAPLTNWIRVATNQFDSNANLYFTNALNPKAAKFFLLQMP